MFNPASLPRLSERLITSHHENNYAGSVKALNMIETRLAAALADTDLPPVVYGGFKREELHRTGSVVLHEAYFDGLGGNGQAAGSIRDPLGPAFRWFDPWDPDFPRHGMNLPGRTVGGALDFNHLHSETPRWGNEVYQNYI